MDLLLILIFWILSWLLVFGIKLLLRKKEKGWSPIWSSFYFLFFTLLTIFIFRNIFKELIVGFSISPFVFLGLALILDLLLTYFIPKYFNPPKKIFGGHFELGSLKMKFRYFFPRFFELLFQQTMIVLLISLLIKNNYNPLIFIPVFVVIHLPLVKIINKLLSLIFIVASIFGAIIFYFLIININYGFVYSYIVHWLFYTFLGLFFWAFYGRRRN